MFILFWSFSKYAVGLDETEPSYFGVAYELDSARNDAHCTKSVLCEALSRSWLRRSRRACPAAAGRPHAGGGCRASHRCQAQRRSSTRRVLRRRAIPQAL